MNLMTTVVSAAMLGMLSPAVAHMSIQPIMAAKRADNFAAAESVAVTFAATAEKTSELPEVPDSCDLDESQSENSVYEISCSEGEGQFVQTVSRSFRLEIRGVHGLSANADDDSDGFDDVTGLPTHYWECYSGWDGVGSLKNNCELGGPYVIPAYAHRVGLCQIGAAVMGAKGYTYDQILQHYFRGATLNAAY